MLLIYCLWLQVDAVHKLSTLRNTAHHLEENAAHAYSELQRVEESYAKHEEIRRAAGGGHKPQRDWKLERELDDHRYQLETEVARVTEAQAQVEAAEMLLRGKQQLAALIEMVTKQAGVIERLQGQVATQERALKRYSDVPAAATSAAAASRLDQLRFRLESELTEYTELAAQVSSAAAANLQDDQMARLTESVAKKGLLIQRLQSEVAERTGAVEVEQRAVLERCGVQQLAALELEGKLRQQLAEAERVLGGVRIGAAEIPGDVAPMQAGLGKGGAAVAEEEGGEEVESMPLGLSESELVHHLMDGERHA